jgi:hypothetical protein
VTSIYPLFYNFLFFKDLDRISASAIRGLSGDLVAPAGGQTGPFRPATACFAHAEAMTAAGEHLR